MNRSWPWLLSLVLVVFLAAPDLGDGDEEWQLWSTGSLQARPDQRWKLALEQQLRFKADMSNFYYRYSDFGVIWKAATWLEAGLHFAQLCQKSGDDWKEEHRPFVDGTVKQAWSPIQVADRHRLERRLREEAPDLWRYRNKLTLAGRSGWTGFRILPYAYGEVFIHLRETDFYRWRLCGGIKGRAGEKISVDISYLRQGTEKGEHWTHCHALGVKLLYAL